MSALDHDLDLDRRTGLDEPPRGPEGPAPDEGGGDGGSFDEGRSGVSPWMLIVLLAAAAFLGGAITWAATRPSDPSAGSVDVGFEQDMITHHEQAVQMALLELGNGTDPVVRGFAQEIVTFQQYEVGLMDQQLQSWGQSRANRPDVAMAWMGEPVPVAQMPGLATDEQMDQLRDARGAEADALFLQLMAAHHRGGIHMALDAAERAGDASVRLLAGRMAHNQAVEINEYRQVAERQGLDVDIEAYPDVPPAPSAT